MVVSTFRRPIGANADAKELEYVTALHQTTDEDEDTFVDGSIEAMDVKYYLMSRYGIEVQKEDIQKLIFQDLAGGNSETECMDICELVAILLIPFFVKHVQHHDEDDHNIEKLQRAFSSDSHMQSFMEDMKHYNAFVSSNGGGIFQHVLNIILADSTGVGICVGASTGTSTGSSDSNTPPSITKELLQTIFARYGELGLSQDEQLIEEMIRDVSGGEGAAVLDADAFARALTQDVMLYNSNHESRVSTFYEDVFGRIGEEDEDEDGEGEQKLTFFHNSNSKNTNTNTNTNSNETDPLQADPELNIEKNSKTSTTNVFRKVFTLSQVDFLADGCQSKIHLTFIYLIFVFEVYLFSNNDPITVCPHDTFGCNIANSIVFWLIIVGIMVGVGVPYILTLSSGNVLRAKSPTGIISVMIGVLGIGLFIATPIWVKFRLGILSNWEKEGQKSWEQEKYSPQVIFLRVVAHFFAIVLLSIQMMNLIRIIKPAVVTSKNRLVAYLFTRGKYEQQVV